MYLLWSESCSSRIGLFMYFPPYARLVAGECGHSAGTRQKERNTSFQQSRVRPYLALPCAVSLRGQDPAIKKFKFGCRHTPTATARGFFTLSSALLVVRKADRH